MHPIVRQAVYAQRSPAHLAGAHLRLAEMLMGEGAAHELVAAHLLQATGAGNAWVVEALNAAAECGLGRGARGSAVRYLRRAAHLQLISSSTPPTRSCRASAAWRSTSSATALPGRYRPRSCGRGRPQPDAFCSPTWRWRAPARRAQGEVLQLAQSALARGALLDEETSDGLGFYFAAAALAIAEDLQGAELALATAVEDARSRGSVLGFATACYFRGWTVLCRGRVADAPPTGRTRSPPSATAGAWASPARTRSWPMRSSSVGERAAAGRELELGAAEASGEMPLPFLIASRTAFLLRGGQHREALDVYLECAERLAAAVADNPACFPWRSGAAMAYERLGGGGAAPDLWERRGRSASIRTRTWGRSGTGAPSSRAIRSLLTVHAGCVRRGAPVKSTAPARHICTRRAACALSGPGLW